MTDMDRLKNFLTQKRYHKSSDIIRWGVDNHSNRADRNKRILVRDGFLRKITDQEKIMMFGDIREDVYETLNHKETYAA